MDRYVSVSVWDMTDDELDHQAATRAEREPEHAAELRRFKDWRRTHRHLDTRPPHLQGREFPVRM
jgi:hypothetical protein